MNLHHLLLLLFLLPLLSCGGGVEENTTLIHNVRIADGSGEPVYEGSVRIQGDRIVEVASGELPAQPGEQVIDGQGQVLCPGFIDTHSHHDGGMIDKPGMPEVVSQGITTIVVGQDGGSHFPLAGLWQQLDSFPVAVNVASYAGHNTIRRRVMAGDDYQREATAAESEKMRQLLEQEMTSGALGLSTGLEYDPGIYASKEEVLQLAGVLKKTGGRYISHLRSEDRYLWEAIDELLNIGRIHGIPVQISHLKIAIVSQWGKADSLLQVLEQARDEGIKVTADVYPYEYWQSTMTVLFPERDFQDLEAARYALTELTTPDGMIISYYEADPSLEGKLLSEVAADRGEEPAKIYLDLINTAIEQDAGESIICRSMASEDVARLISWPWSNVCSDGSLDGSHPRGAGSFPRALKKFVFEENRMELSEAVRQMTALAAENVGIAERGRIQPGYFADLVLLDPATVADRATFEDPGALSEGIMRVWVNGQEVWNGDVTEALPGRGLRR